MKAIFKVFANEVKIIWRVVTNQVFNLKLQKVTAMFIHICNTDSIQQKGGHKGNKNQNRSSEAHQSLSAELSSDPATEEKQSHYFIYLYLLQKIFFYCFQIPNTTSKGWKFANTKCTLRMNAPLILGKAKNEFCAKYSFQMSELLRRDTAVNDNTVSAKLS